MSDAPEQVWVDFFDEPESAWCGDAFSTDSGDTEYIRADIHAARIAEQAAYIKELEAELEEYADG